MQFGTVAALKPLSATACRTSVQARSPSTRRGRRHCISHRFHSRTPCTRARAGRRAPSDSSRRSRGRPDPGLDERRERRPPCGWLRCAITRPARLGPARLRAFGPQDSSGRLRPDAWSSPAIARRERPSSRSRRTRTSVAARRVRDEVPAFGDVGANGTVAVVSARGSSRGPHRPIDRHVALELATLGGCASRTARADEEESKPPRPRRSRRPAPQILDVSRHAAGRRRAGRAWRPRPRRPCGADALEEPGRRRDATGGRSPRTRLVAAEPSSDHPFVTRYALPAPRGASQPEHVRRRQSRRYCLLLLARLAAARRNASRPREAAGESRPRRLLIASPPRKIAGRPAGPFRSRAGKLQGGSA